MAQVAPLPQQRHQTVVGFQDLSARIRDDHHLLGGADALGDLVELRLGDDELDRPELQRHLRHGGADQFHRGDVGGRPGIGRAFDHLMPLREGSARRKSLGSSSSEGDLKGLPPQVMVRTRSGRNQSSNSSASPETRAAATPAAAPTMSENSGASAAMALVA